MQTKKTQEYLKYEFSPNEARENAKKLARAIQQIAELELKKKQIMADLKSEADTAASDSAKLARWVNDGFDYRQIDCEVVFHAPREGYKTLIRLDTYEHVKNEPMTWPEKQDNLFEEIPTEPQPEEAA